MCAQQNIILFTQIIFYQSKNMLKTNQFLYLNFQVIQYSKGATSSGKSTVNFNDKKLFRFHS